MQDYVFRRRFQKNQKYYPIDNINKNSQYYQPKINSVAPIRVIFKKKPDFSFQAFSLLC
jgi:hypothetical protein